MSIEGPGPIASAVTRVPCPACGEPFPWPPDGRCARCAVDLTDGAADVVFELDRRCAALASERTEAVRRLEATRPPSAPPSPPQAPRPATAGAGRSGVPALLGLAGAALLTAAAVVFTAVAWTALPAVGKAAILLAATGLSATASLALHRRGTTIAGAALGALTMALALIDVVGSERTGLLALGEYALPIGWLVAGAAGALLARRGVGWVALLGVLGAAVGAVLLTGALAEVYDLGAPTVTVIGTAAAVGLAGSRPLWPHAAARSLAAALAGTGLVAAGMVSVVAVGAQDASLVAGLAATALPVAGAAAALRWTGWALLPTTLLPGAAVVAAAAALGVEDFGLAAVTGGVVAAVAWAGVDLEGERRAAVLLGGAPLAVPVAVVTVATAARSLGRVADVVAGDPGRTVEGWAAATVVLAAAAALAHPRVRRVSGWTTAAVLLVVTAALPVTAAWLVLAVLAAAGSLLAARIGGHALPPVLLAVGAVAWAGGSPATTAIAATWAVGVAANAGARSDGVRAAVSVGTAVAAAALAVGGALRAITVSVDVALGAGLLTALLLAAAVRNWPTMVRPGAPIPGAPDGSGDATPEDAAVTAVGAAATVVAVAAASAPTAMGMLLLTAAVGWLAVAAAGWWPARWITSAVASLGVGFLLADAGVTTVEAYTIVPAVALGAVGLRWLSRTRVSSVMALWPALSVGLAPSLLVLLAEPRVLARTLLLTLVSGLLAAAGVRLRWLAPTVAGGVAAIGVAISQGTVAVSVAPRWITFGTIGALLVWLAATYETQQQRARRAGARLTGYR